MSNNDHFYVTTPIYYVNDKPHIGHAYTTILADVLARYHRLLGVPTWFLTGTDEHGQKVAQAAAANGITPREQCDRTVVRFQELWKHLDITCDDFIRTTEERHTSIVRKVLQDLYDRGEIYPAEYEGWYCVTCERFFPEKDLLDGCCPECRKPVEKLVERNYFFRMGKYQEWLIAHINEHPEFIQPEHRRQETLGFLRKPLEDLCVSRPKSRLAWGIELPFDKNYVTYVWFDALLNYVSGVGYGSDAAMFGKWWPASCQLIGKDILTTHTVYWPTMLKAMGVPLPKTVFAHGWWLVGRDKMSKSLGNVVNPMTMAETYGIDAFRYFLMAEMTLGQDASFTEEAFVKRYNSDLANDLGNLASRVHKMIQRNLGGSLPARHAPGAAEESLVAATLHAVRQMEECLGGMQINRGLAEVAAAVREGNRYFDQMAPWKLAKDNDLAALEKVLYAGAECLRIVSGLLYPVMPAKMTELRRALGLTDAEIVPRRERLAAWEGLEPGRPVGELAALFPRIEKEKPAAPAESAKKAEAKPEKSGKPAKSAAVEPPPGVVEFADFAKLQLRTAKVLQAERVEGADRLLKLQLEVGSETRQIIAGVAASYAPADIAGKTIVIVANLKPAVIRGIQSNGMLLAAKDASGSFRLVTVDGAVPSGTPVG